MTGRKTNEDNLTEAILDLGNHGVDQVSVTEGDIGKTTTLTLVPDPDPDPDPAPRNDLLHFIKSIEALIDEKDDIQEAITGQFDTAKSYGFDPKVMKQIIKLRAMEDGKGFIAVLNDYMVRVDFYGQLRLPFDGPCSVELTRIA